MSAQESRGSVALRVRRRFIKEKALPTTSAAERRAGEEPDILDA
jgi:hypothetical protein